jgi:hypothetical protein
MITPNHKKRIFYFRWINSIFCYANAAGSITVLDRTWSLYKSNYNLGNGVFEYLDTAFAHIENIILEQ